MDQVQTKETIRETYVARQAAREDERLDARTAKTAEAINSAEVETRMSVAEGLSFLRDGGEREDVALATSRFCLG